MHTRWLAALCLLAGCASAPVRPARPTIDLSAADARLLEGCYGCLAEARDIYARAATGPQRRLVLPRLFEAELLIALRDKEFALDPAPALARARALGPELPAAIDVERYLRLVEAMPYESAGWTRAEAAKLRSDQVEFSRHVDDELRWLRDDVLSPAVAEYLARAIDCGYASRSTTPNRVKFERPHEAAAPLIRFRAAVCTPGLPQLFEGLHANGSGFVDASYYLGVLAVSTLPDGGPDPRPFISEIQRSLPDSPSVVYLAATMQQTLGNCEAALPLFDRVIALKPQHEGGWLGRIVCLTALQRTTDAIAAATQVIDLKLANRDEAYYWRGRNYHGLGQLALARADSDMAKSMRIKSDIFTLAGLVEHDQDDLEIAEKDLQRAQQMDRGTNCFAAWTLGSVYVKRQAWPQAAAAFDAARVCNEKDALARQAAMATLEANAAIDPEFRTNQVAVMRTFIDRARHEQYAAALNSANFFYQSGDIDKARELLDIAELDPALTTEVASLRLLVPKVPGASRPPAEP